MSATPKTDALFFPYGRDATAAAEPSLLVCMTQYELLERELAALRLNLSVTMEELGEMRDRAEKAEADNATLREQLKDCSAAFDRQQEQLDRNAEQIAAQLDELHRISEALGTNEGHSSVTHIELLKAENAKLRELLRLCKPAVRNVYPSTDPLLEAIDAARNEEGK